MFRLTQPADDEVRRFVSEQSHSNFSYSEVGASAGEAPKRYNLDRNGIQLGTGEVTWHGAVEAIRGWDMFDIPWVRLYWPTTPIQVGIDVAVSVHHFGFYWLNACRIVYVVDEDGLTKRYGFAYGTLAQHAERGEERFTVEWDRSDDRVSYHILAFSRPHEALARLAFPLTRALQRNFAEASKMAMLRAVTGTK